MCIVTVKKPGSRLATVTKLPVPATRTNWVAERTENAIGSKGLPPATSKQATRAFSRNTSPVTMCSVRWAGSRPGK